MSTNKTEHLHLHAWTPEDLLRRTEFNENFQKLDTAIHSLQTGLTAAGNCRIAYGSYTGTGKSGGSYPNRLDFAETLGKAPAFLYVSRENSFDYMFLIRGMTYQTSNFPDFGSSETNSITWTATGVSWSTEYGASPQLNQSGVKYYYVAMG